jgi:hypothetical protein
VTAPVTTTFDPVAQAPLCNGAPRRLRVSWSALKRWEACHQRQKLYAEGKRSRIYDGRAFLPGTLADRCMRRWLEAGLEDRANLQPGGMLEYLEEEWATHTGPQAEYPIRWRGDPRQDKREVIYAISDALRKLEPILMDKVLPYDYRPEYRFVSVVGIPGTTEMEETVQIEIIGAVDVAVCMGPGRYGLYDLKLTRSDDYIRSTLAQLTFYDLAFHGWIGHQPTEHQFWAPLTQEVIIGTDITAAERAAMVSRIIQYAHGVWLGNWTLTTNKDQECFHCPVKHACPRFVPRISVDQQGRNRIAFTNWKDGNV